MSKREALPDSSILSARLDELRWRLFENEKNDAYVFVDPVLRSPWDRPWTRKGDVSSGNIEHIIDLAMFGVEKERSPFFVRIARSTSWLLDASFEIATREACASSSVRSVCGWFTSPLPLPALRSVIGAQMRRRDGAKHWLMRFYDPRVVRHLQQLLCHGFAVHGVSVWWSLDDFGKLRRTQGVPAPSGGFRVTAEDIPALDSLGLVNQAFGQWRTLDDPMPEDAYDRIFAAMACARRHGLPIERAADCLSFVLHRCLVHPRIECHPDVARWLSLAADGRGSYVDAAANASREWWDEVATGHWIIAAEGEAHG
ncbi:DUF4123 domain-containing protein [Luteimonas sp. FCS-9]|uniref:DUF4123 domain-containing protein n=1 Tax=Luteimonas sp. FCS-9 TaxID=1547516 RepID=UPI000ACBF206|nr:DUF4123 domain-containing protein [Luteimonas sp. FCS-9]